LWGPQKEDAIGTTELVYFLGSGCVIVIILLGISYWAVNFFIRQCSERSLERFRTQIATEAELAIRAFREGLAEQIVLQENKSDSLAKLYATMIDLLQIGRDFMAALAKGDMETARRKVQNLREMCDIFAGAYQKQSLHFSEQLCAILDKFVADQRGVLDFVEAKWSVTVKNPSESEKRDFEIRKEWLKFEDQISATMETLRTEFRTRQPSGNVMLAWLKEAAGQGSATAKAAVKK